MHKSDNLTLKELEEYEERAAIMQYDGGLSKEQAEREAYKIIERKRNADNIRTGGSKRSA